MKGGTCGETRNKDNNGEESWERRMIVMRNNTRMKSRVERPGYSRFVEDRNCNTD